MLHVTPPRGKEVETDGNAAAVKGLCSESRILEAAILRIAKLVGERIAIPNLETTHSAQYAEIPLSE